MDIAEIKQRLNANIESLCAKLLPNGSKKGVEWRAGSIVGDTGGSLGVHLTGDKTGIWCDFATGDAGDVIDLIARVRSESLSEALLWAEGYLGIAKPFKAERKASYKPGIRPRDVAHPRETVLEYLTTSRKLSTQTISQFKLGQVSRTVRIDDEQVPSECVCFPFILPTGELAMTKYLAIERSQDGKKLIWTDAGTRPTLFGWHVISPQARTVVLCEGELNCMSWHQYGIAALATPRGAGKGAKHDWINTEWDNLNRFETIYLNFDPDEAGQESILELPERLGRHRVKVIPPLLFKDANECLQNNVPVEQMLAALSAANTCDPAELRSIVEYASAVHRAFYPEPADHQGWALPFEGAGAFRLRRGELSVWTGFNFSGKTACLNQVMLNLARQDERVVIASLEMQPARLLERIFRQATGERTPAQEYIDETFAYLNNKVWLFDQQGAVKADNLLEIFDYALRRYGARFFIIDSLMKLGLGFDDFNGQKLLTERLQTFALQKDVHIALVAHPRKADRANEDRPPSKMDVSGVGNITDMADSVLILWRNTRKQKALWAHMNGSPQSNYLDLLHAPDGKLICDKERNGDGQVFEIPLWYHLQSMQFRDTESGIVKPILPYGEPDKDFNWEIEF